jgi:hypothetical protein
MGLHVTNTARVYVKKVELNFAQIWSRPEFALDPSIVIIHINKSLSHQILSRLVQSHSEVGNSKKKRAKLMDKDPPGLLLASTILP